jgi:uncharacterized phosphosugar-binding protein
MGIAASWIFCVLVTAIILFVVGAKTAEVRRINNTLLDALAELVNALDQQPIELSDHVNDNIEYARDVVESYDKYKLTLETLPR